MDSLNHFPPQIGNPISKNRLFVPSAGINRFLFFKNCTVTTDFYIEMLYSSLKS
jgi:hypothetical protein